MKALSLFSPALPITIRLTVFLILINTFPGAISAETVTPKKNGEETFFTWNLLWTGSWLNNFKIEEEHSPGIGDLFSGGTLFNRGDLRLGLPGQELSFRALAADKRTLPFDGNDTWAGFSPGLGLYFKDCRLLRGVQSEYGLPARINNVWLRSVPFTEARSPSIRELKTEPGSRDIAETSLYLALPPISDFGVFASGALDDEMNPSLGGGFGYYGTKAEARLEGFYARKKLESRKAQSWFSPLPPLPERDFNIRALGLTFVSSPVAFGTDWAWSETFAWGRGVYANFALRLGNKPWRFSLAGDGAMGRFAGRNGGTEGTGFRVSTKGEWFRPRSGLLRFQGIFRSPAPGEMFNRGSLSLYFRPSAPGAGAAPVFRFSRASLGFSRDARIPEKIADSIDLLLGFRLGFLHGVFSCALDGRSLYDGEGKNPPLFDPGVFESFESFRVSGDFGWKPGIFTLGTRLGCTVKPEYDPVWDISVNCSVKPGRWGRIGIKIASPDFPKKWNYSLSWRIESRFF